MLGAYCILGSLFMVGGLLWFPAVRKNRWRFILTAAMCVSLGLALFEVLSALLGITRFGEPVQFNYPQDYLGRGPFGWLLMILPILAVISPLLLAAWLSRKAGRGEQRP